ncbi:MAG: hypothetical protein R6U98_36790 [Pirellulaceae bacterium]
MSRCPTQAVLPLGGLAAEKVIRDRYRYRSRAKVPQAANRQGAQPIPYWFIIRRLLEPVRALCERFKYKSPDAGGQTAVLHGHGMGMARGVRKRSKSVRAVLSRLAPGVPALNEGRKGPQGPRERRGGLARTPLKVVTDKQGENAEYLPPLSFWIRAAIGGPTVASGTPLVMVTARVARSSASGARPRDKCCKPASASFPNLRGFHRPTARGGWLCLVLP